MSDITPEERRQNIKQLVDSVSSTAYEIDSWVGDGNLEQAYAAIEAAEETLNDIRDWLNELSDETETDTKGAAK